MRIEVKGPKFSCWATHVLRKHNVFSSWRIRNSVIPLPFWKLALIEKNFFSLRRLFFMSWLGLDYIMWCFNPGNSPCFCSWSGRSRETELPNTYIPLYHFVINWPFWTYLDSRDHPGIIILLWLITSICTRAWTVCWTISYFLSSSPYW